MVMKEFHVSRSKALVDWIFHVRLSSLDNTEVSSKPCEMYYLSCSNIGLAKGALESRKSNEAWGEHDVQTKLSKEYNAKGSMGVFDT